MDVGEVPFSLRAVVGKAVLTKEEFNSLNLGDIILLDQEVHCPLVVHVGENGLLFGYAGLFSGQKAIKVEQLP